MPKQWNLKQNIPKNDRQSLESFSDLAAQLLYNREITSPEEAEVFLNPRYENLHSPFLFQDMNKAVLRIWQAIEKKEKICIYGDYDADAVTANAVLQQMFRYLGMEVASYIPDRFSEGYGINMEALSKIKDQGSTIIITVDCGTNSVDAAEFCKKNNIDFIITDHHEIIGPLPDAFALINPKNDADAYPFREITGVGVAFKLACGMLSDKGRVGAAISRVSSERIISAPTKPINGYEKWLLDLVAIGTVADCHSLTGENRILVKYGLQVLAKTRWAGLRALCEVAKVDFASKLPDTYSLGFIIAPRLNAAGRLEHANIALEVLMELDPIVAGQKAQALEKINERRQDQTARILSEAKEQVEFIKDRKVIAVAGEGWSKGVVGLVAGKLAEEYQKPTFVLATESGESTGSARTVGEFDVLEALRFASGHITRFGGHKQAAGLTLQTDQFDLFYQKVLQYAETTLPDKESHASLELDAQLAANQLSFETCRLLQQFEPFGVGNPKPVFYIPKVSIVSTKCVGTALQHLQVKVMVQTTAISGILFHCSDFAKALKPGDVCDVAAELTEDSWNGRKSVKLRIVDIKA